LRVVFLVSSPNQASKAISRSLPFLRDQLWPSYNSLRRPGLTTRGQPSRSLSRNASENSSPLVASATNNIEEARKFLPSYSYVNGYLWKDYPLAAKLKEEIEKKFHTQFDYVLSHIYEDGEANIGWHNDKESLY